MAQKTNPQKGYKKGGNTTRRKLGVWKSGNRKSFWGGQGPEGSRPEQNRRVLLKGGVEIKGEVQGGGVGGTRG